jgi:hypothetical protein
MDKVTHEIPGATEALHRLWGTNVASCQLESSFMLAEIKIVIGFFDVLGLECLRADGGVWATKTARDL